MSFAQLGLSDVLVQTVAQLGYQTPTQIQTQAIPVILQGRDVIAAAQTGTGKTASFVLPILEKLRQGQTQRKKRVRALILVPTRELAMQVAEKAEQYGQATGLTSLAVFGGVDEKVQKQRLLDGVDVLVATPGRLMDLYGQRAVYFEEIEMVVLD
ncbi:MAG: DEAD/DEAH box helicase, partial [Vibrio sp.]